MQFYNFNDGSGHVPARRHANGGGWVALSAFVAPTVYVGMCAVVFGYARVTGNSKITGEARVGGILLETGLSTTIHGDVTITDRAQVLDAVMITGRARICGDAMVFGNANISGQAIVAGRARVGHYVTLKDDVYVTDAVRLVGKQTSRIILSGARLLHGNKMIDKTFGATAEKVKERQRRDPNPAELATSAAA